MVPVKSSCARATGWLLTFFLLSGWPGASTADPVVSQVSSESAGSIENGDEIVILGTGFGSKASSAPVLYDFASHAYENGDLNAAHSLLKGTSGLPLGVNEESSAVWSTSTSSFYFSADAQRRHRYSEGTYFLDGENAWVGRPVAYGGSTGWDTPIDNSQLYVSWWYKNKYNSTYYWRFSPNQQNGEFTPGEELTIETPNDEKRRGLYVGMDSEGLHNAVLYGHRNKNDIAGIRIRGNSSGASTIFPEEFRAGSGYGYETPGSKLARVWDDPDGKAGIRSSVALHNAYVSPSKDGFSRATIYYNLTLPEDQWVHMEYELDTEKGIFRLYEDGRLLGEEKFSPEAVYAGKYSPTLSLLGTNAKQLVLQESWISEIYMDNSFQRVLVGNAAEYANVTHRELQRPTGWKDNEIKAVLQLGSLDVTQGLYVYVVDRDGTVNSKGFPLCEGNNCPAPPQKILLEVN